MPNNENAQQTLAPQNSRWCLFWKVVKAIVAVIGLAGTALTIFQVYRWLGSDPYVKVMVLDNRCLTKVESIPDLKCTYNFKGNNVSSLWVSRISLRNCCQRNIIGTSYHDLMSTNIMLFVSEGYKVLNVEVERNDFDADIQKQADGFAITFKKWRPEEDCLLNVYVEGDSPSDPYPTYREAFEAFTQGKVEINELQQERQTESIVRRLPHWLLFGIKWLGYIVYLFVLGLSFWGLFININWVAIYKRLRWNRKYLDLVQAYIRRMQVANGTNSVNMNCLPQEFWTENKIPLPPKNSVFVKGKHINMSELMPILILCFIGALLSLIALIGVSCI